MSSVCVYTLFFLLYKNPFYKNTRLKNAQNLSREERIPRLKNAKNFYFRNCTRLWKRSFFLGLCSSVQHCLYFFYIIFLSLPARVEAYFLLPFGLYEWKITIAHPILTIMF